MYSCHDYVVSALSRAPDFRLHMRAVHSCAFPHGYQHMTTTIDRELVRRLRTPAYSFLAVTLLFQIFDYVSGQLPLQFGAVVWRFAALGSASNTIGNVLLLLLLVFALSLMVNDRPIMLLVGILSLLIAVFLLGGAAVFTLDGLQVRSSVEPASLAKFDLATGQALVKLCVEGIVALIFAVSAFRARVAAKRNAARGARPADTPLIVRPPATRAP